MEVHLVDGTYELFRHFYSPGGGHENSSGREVGAVRGVMRSMLQMLEDGATHLGVATDHVIESFRNDLYGPYKDGSGIDEVLFQQFPLLEDALRALGVTVWPMVEVEADDALAAAAKVASETEGVSRAVICTPDKDLAQCVTDPKVIQYDRRARQFRDEAAVTEKYGVPPASIPDWLALVGDSADGFPGLPGWGAKSSAVILSHYGKIEDIPHAPGKWEVSVRGAAKLAKALQDGFEDALLFKRLAILETDVDVGSVAEWKWEGPTVELAAFAAELDAPDVLRRAERLRT